MSNEVASFETVIERIPKELVVHDLISFIIGNVNNLILYLVLNTFKDLRNTRRRKSIHFFNKRFHQGAKGTVHIPENF